MKGFKLLLAGCITTLLSGCAANGFYEGVHNETPKDIETITKKNFVGIPVLLAMEGSSVKLNDEWRATVAHNKPLLLGKDVYYHPVCDFALYREKSDNDIDVKFGYVHLDEDVFLTGYPLAMTFSSHKGKFIGDIIDPKDNCLYSGTDATVISGMSGGGAFNAKGELIGVNVGISFGELKWKNGRTANSPSMFISLNAVSDFIEKTIGERIHFEGKE